jgi:hypothetical protein
MLHDGACPQRWIRAVSLPRGPGLPMAMKKRQAERYDVTTTRHVQLNQFSSVQSVQSSQSSPVRSTSAQRYTAPQLYSTQSNSTFPRLISS